MKILFEILGMIVWLGYTLVVMILVLLIPEHYFGEPGRIVGAFSIVVCLVVYVHFKEGRHEREQRSKRKIG